MKEKIELMPYEREVFYYETDKMGIVHHSNYVKWLEEARNNFMVQIGYPFDKVENENLMVPVLDVYCKYIKAFRFGDSFSIRLIPKGFNGLRFSMDYEIRNKSNGEIYATGSSSHCFVNNDMNGYRILMNRLTPDVSTEEKLTTQLVFHF